MGCESQSHIPNYLRERMLAVPPIPLNSRSVEWSPSVAVAQLDPSVLPSCEVSGEPLIIHDDTTQWHDDPFPGPPMTAPQCH